MENKVYIGIPLIISSVVELFFPYLKTLRCDKIWFAPSLFFCVALFIASNVLLGFTLYEASEIDDNILYAFTFVCVFLNVAWAYFIFAHRKYAILTLFLNLMFAYFCYNSIFLEESFDKNKKLTYLNLFTLYIIWLGFMITINFEHSRDKNNKK